MDGMPDQGEVSRSVRDTFANPPAAVSTHRQRKAAMQGGKKSYRAGTRMPRASSMPQAASLRTDPDSLQQPLIHPAATRRMHLDKPISRGGRTRLRHDGAMTVLAGIADLIHQTVMYHSLADVCSLRATSRQLRDTCSQDAIWESLYKLRWPHVQQGQALAETGWRHRFMKRLRQLRDNFVRRSLPGLVRKSQRRDGLPDLHMVHTSLQIRYRLSIFQRHAPTAHLEFSDTSVQPFDSAVCLRCSFSSLQVLCPFRLLFRGRSSTIGREESLLEANIDTWNSWGDTLANDGMTFVRSPCGRLLLAFWENGNLLAGIYASLTYKHIFQLMWPECKSSDSLAGRPRSDDLDSCLCLHGYTLRLTLRDAKVECLSNTFYKVAAYRLGGYRAGSFGTVRASGRQRIRSWKIFEADAILYSEVSMRRTHCVQS